MRLELCVGLLAVGALGCDLDAAVFVAPSVTSSSVTVMPSGLVTGVSGTIELNLRLGSRASGPAEVTLQSLSLTNADRSVTVVDTVGASPNPTFPVTVGVDSDVTVSFSVDAADNQLAADAVDILCGSGDLVYVLVLDDTLRGGSITAEGDPVTPAGCP